MSFAAFAQSAAKSAEGQRLPEGVVLPPGAIVVIPGAEPGGGQARSFQLPKDWAAQRPQGVPPGKEWPNIVYAEVPKGSTSWFEQYKKDQNLIATQTAAITFLSDRLDKLESRIKELESKTGGQKK
jgi:hypothetical protein